MKPKIEADWEYATFEGARRYQAKKGALQLKAHERIQWACEMSELIRTREAEIKSGNRKAKSTKQP